MSNTIIIEGAKSCLPILGHHFDSMQWVLNARSKDTTRAIQYLYCDDGWLVCTDGHRMHVYVPYFEELPMHLQMENGMYDVVSMTKSKIILTRIEDPNIEFPDYYRIMQYKPVNGIQPFHSDLPYRSKPYDRSLVLSRFYRHVYQIAHFNCEYLAQALWYDDEIRMERTGRNDMSALIMAGRDKIAVIMPIKE